MPRNAVIAAILAPSGRGSRLAASHARACSRYSSTLVAVVAVIGSLPSTSEPVDPADPLAVPFRVAVEHPVGREPAEIEVQVVLPGEADPPVGLPPHLGPPHPALTRAA